MYIVYFSDLSKYGPNRPSKYNEIMKKPKLSKCTYYKVAPGYWLYTRGLDDAAQQLVPSNSFGLQMLNSKRILEITF